MPLIGRVCLGRVVPSAGAALSFYLAGSGFVSSNVSAVRGSRVNCHKRDGLSPVVRNGTEGLDLSIPRLVPGLRGASETLGSASRAADTFLYPEVEYPLPN